MFDHYSYLIGSVLLVGLFIHAYFIRPDLRRQMLMVGLYGGVVGIILEKVFLQDYWRPDMVFRIGSFGGPEDFLFGFVAIGWGSVAYQIYFKKIIRTGSKHRHWILPLMILSEFLAVYFGMRDGVNSIYASSVGLVLPALLVIAIRRDLIVDAVYTALFLGLLLVSFETLVFAISPSLESRFLLYYKVAHIGRAPITELLWGVCAGGLIGVWYEFYTGQEEYSKPKKFGRKKMRRQSKPRRSFRDVGATRQ